MKALALKPGVAGSAHLIDLPEPVASSKQLLVEMMCVGVCGTDREILAGRYGAPPPGQDFLVIGHESLGRVLKAPKGSGFNVGDLVVGMVRHPDPVPCPNCAVGEWDMCTNGRYTEHGIKGLDGFARERYLLDPLHTVKVDAALGELGVLLEPASVVAKAWEHIERIGHRARFVPRRALVMGAGPIGLLAALMARQRDLEVYVYNRGDAGPKVDLVRGLGGAYMSDLADVKQLCSNYDVILECTGAGSLIIEAMCCVGPGGVVCLTGVSSGGHKLTIDPGALNRELVLENEAIFGSVNANRRHYEAAAKALVQADRDWLSGLITERVPLESWPSAFERTHDTIKSVLMGTAK